MKYEKLSAAEWFFIVFTFLTSLYIFFPNRKLDHMIQSGYYRNLRECLLGPTGTMGEGEDRNIDSEWILPTFQTHGLKKSRTDKSRMFYPAILIFIFKIMKSRFFQGALQSYNKRYITSRAMKALIGITLK